MGYDDCFVGKMISLHNKILNKNACGYEQEVKYEKSQCEMSNLIQDLFITISNLLTKT
jgi:hypothetical protein